MKNITKIKNAIKRKVNEQRLRSTIGNILDDALPNILSEIDQLDQAFIDAKPVKEGGSPLQNKVYDAVTGMSTNAIDDFEGKFAIKRGKLNDFVFKLTDRDAAGILKLIKQRKFEGTIKELDVRKAHGDKRIENPATGNNIKLRTALKAKKGSAVYAKGKSMYNSLKDKPVNEAKQFGVKDIMTAAKNKSDWGDLADHLYMKGGNMVHIDSWYYGETKAMKQLVDSWKKGGSNYDYWNKEHGVDFKIVDTFSEVKAQGRHKKLTSDGIVGVVLRVIPGKLNEVKFKSQSDVDKAKKITFPNGKFFTRDSGGKWITKGKSLRSDDKTMAQFVDYAKNMKNIVPVFEGKLTEAAPKFSIINKARAKAAIIQIKRGKRDDGMGKFTATLFGIDRNGDTQEITDLRDLNKYDKFGLGESIVRKDITVNENADYRYLTKVILSAKSKKNVFYNKDHNVVNIGGVGYDGGDLVTQFKQKTGSSTTIKNNFYHAQQDPNKTKKEVEKLSKGRIKVGVDRGIVKYSLSESVTEGKINEDRMDQTKMFDTSTVNKIVNDIKKLLKWKKEQYGNQSFDYSEHNFKDGSGGFGFKWDHSRNMGGQIGISLGKDGNHRYYAYSWYDKKYTGSATTNNMKPVKFKGNPEVWQDFTSDHLLQFWKKVKGEIKKNEAGAKSALDREAKAQSAYYGSKADTGRIGYGLSSQPRRGR